jgi:hypothetical protein
MQLDLAFRLLPARHRRGSPPHSCARQKKRTNKERKKDTMSNTLTHVLGSVSVFPHDPGIIPHGSRHHPHGPGIMGRLRMGARP